MEIKPNSNSRPREFETTLVLSLVTPDIFRSGFLRRDSNVILPKCETFRREIYITQCQIDRANFGFSRLKIHAVSSSFIR